MLVNPNETSVRYCMFYHIVWYVTCTIGVGDSLTTSQVAMKVCDSSSTGVVYRERCSSIMRPISMAATTVGCMEPWDTNNE